MNNSRQTQMRTIIKMEKYIRNEPSIEEQKRIKQEQEKMYLNGSINMNIHYKS